MSTACFLYTEFVDLHLSICRSIERSLSKLCLSPDPFTFSSESIFSFYSSCPEEGTPLSFVSALHIEGSGRTQKPEFKRGYLCSHNVWTSPFLLHHSFFLLLYHSSSLSFSITRSPYLSLILLHRFSFFSITPSPSLLLLFLLLFLYQSSSFFFSITLSHPSPSLLLLHHSFSSSFPSTPLLLLFLLLFLLLLLLCIPLSLVKDHNIIIL